MPLCDCRVRKLCWSNALQISLRLAERGFYSAGPEVPSAAFVCSHRGPSGRKEKLVILWLIGRLSRANKDICFLAEVLTNPNLSCSILSFFLFLWYPQALFFSIMEISETWAVFLHSRGLVGPKGSHSGDPWRQRTFAQGIWPFLQVCYLLRHNLHRLSMTLWCPGRAWCSHPAIHPASLRLFPIVQMRNGELPKDTFNHGAWNWSQVFGISCLWSWFSWVPQCYLSLVVFMACCWLKMPSLEHWYSQAALSNWSILSHRDILKF